MPFVLAFAAADFLHFLDHLRQDRELPAEIYAVGTTGYVALAITIWLVARKDRLAPAAAAFYGFAAAAGFLLVHVVPEWSLLSDAYGDEVAVDGLSWAMAFVPMGAALLLGVAALRAARAAPALRG